MYVVSNTTPVWSDSTRLDDTSPVLVPTIPMWLTQHMYVCLKELCGLHRNCTVATSSTKRSCPVCDVSCLQVFFQDAALLRDDYPTHPAYQLDVFKLPAWEKFAVDFKAAVQQQEEAYLNRDKEVKEQLPQLNARQHEMIESMAKAFQQQQEKQEQLEKNQEMLLQLVQQQQQRQDLLLQVIMRQQQQQQQQQQDMLMEVVQQRLHGGGGQSRSSNASGGVLSGLQGMPIGGLGGAGGVLSGLQGLPIGGLGGASGVLSGLQV